MVGQTCGGNESGGELRLGLVLVDSGPAAPDTKSYQHENVKTPLELQIYLLGFKPSRLQSQKKNNIEIKQISLHHLNLKKKKKSSNLRKPGVYPNKAVYSFKELKSY